MKVIKVYAQEKKEYESAKFYNYDMWCLVSNDEEIIYFINEKKEECEKKQSQFNDRDDTKWKEHPTRIFETSYKVQLT